MATPASGVNSPCRASRLLFMTACSLQCPTGSTIKRVELTALSCGT
jgi:hypothetical protein